MMTVEVLLICLSLLSWYFCGGIGSPIDRRGMKLNQVKFVSSPVQRPVMSDYTGAPIIRNKRQPPESSSFENIISRLSSPDSLHDIIKQFTDNEMENENLLKLSSELNNIKSSALSSSSNINTYSVEIIARVEVCIEYLKRKLSNNKLRHFEKIVNEIQKIVDLVNVEVYVSIPRHIELQYWELEKMTEILSQRLSVIQGQHGDPLFITEIERSIRLIQIQTYLIKVKGQIVSKLEINPNHAIADPPPLVDEPQMDVHSELKKLLLHSIDNNEKKLRYLRFHRIKALASAVDSIGASDSQEWNSLAFSLENAIEISDNDLVLLKSWEPIKSLTEIDQFNIFQTLVNDLHNSDDLRRLRYVFEHKSMQNIRPTEMVSALETRISKLKQLMFTENVIKPGRQFLQVGEKLLNDMKQNGNVASPESAELIDSIDYVTPKDMVEIFKTLVAKVESADDIDRLTYVLDNILAEHMNDFTYTIVAGTLAKHMVDFQARPQVLLTTEEVLQRDLFYERSTNLLHRLSATERFKIIAKQLTNANDINRLKFLSLIVNDSKRSKMYQFLMSRILELLDHELNIPNYHTILNDAVYLLGTLRRTPNNPSLKFELQRLEMDVSYCLTTALKRSLNSQCHFGWSDVDRFNDAVENRVINKIRINSDKFLKILASEELNNKERAGQLRDFVKQMKKRNDMSELITGKSKMLMRDILEHEGFLAYRQKQRIKDLTSSFSQSLPGKKILPFPLSSRTFALSAAFALPLVRGIYGTIVTCQEWNNDTSKYCLIGSAAMALSVISVGASFVAPRFVPWAIDKLNEVALMISPKVSSINRITLFALRSQLTSGVSAILRTLVILPLGFDIYNIIKMSEMIDVCSQQGSGCSSKDKINYIISLTFSSVSIAVMGGLMLSGAGFAVGALVGLAMVVIESLALGINAIVYYNQKYNTDIGENFRIFFHAIAFQPPPADVEALARRTDWVNILKDNVMRILNSKENIIAYGIGIGKFDANKVVSGAGTINMKIANEKYSYGLSRVQPKVNDDIALLCLPKVDKSVAYENKPNNVTGAYYQCDNTFVIAQKNRWNNCNDDSYIAYDLEYVEKGNIIGSNKVNNLFLISSSTTDLNLFGGKGNITNNFLFRNDAFRGNIHIDKYALGNTLDFSNIKSSIVHFTWSNVPKQSLMGRIRFGDNDDDSFYLTANDDSSPNLHVIGRTNKSDNINCNYRQEHQVVLRQVTDNQKSIIVDVRGGKSRKEMDYIIDCRISVIRPFTHIYGSNSSDTSYITHLWLDSEYSESKDTTVAIIEPLQSKFMLVFVHRPLFNSFSKVEYDSRSKSLTWSLRYRSETLHLSIITYHFGVLPQSNKTLDDIEIDPVNCIFVDGFSGSTVTPMIPQFNGSITVRDFNVFSTINSSRLNDVVQRYQNLQTFQPADMRIVTKLTYPKTNESFTFGSHENDTFFIDGTTIFVGGFDGSDVYVLNRNSPTYVRIDNEADDNALDILTISDTTCDTLHAKAESLTSSCCDSSAFDVTLFCINNSTTIHVVLWNYLMDSSFQHLQIFYRDAIYLLLSLKGEENEKSDDVNSKMSVEMALLISFDSSYHSGMIILTSRDTHVVFSIQNGSKNPIVAHRSGADIILTRKNVDGYNSLYVFLPGFFTNYVNIATNWQFIKIFIVKNPAMNNIKISKVLTANDIKKLYLETLAEDLANENYGKTDFVKEYVVNFAIGDDDQSIVINHNDKLSTQRGYKLGVLVVFGVQPKDLNISWTENSTLTLCAHKTCVYIEKWCDPIHRLYRIEFFSSWNHRLIVVEAFDQMKCHQNNDFKNRTMGFLIDRFKKKLSNAQRQLQLMDEDDDSDNSRLLRCIGSMLIDEITHNFTYRLFGFTSLLQHIQFINDNCMELLTFEAVRNVSLIQILRSLNTFIESYVIAESVKQVDELSVQVIRDAIGKLDNSSWQMFTLCLKDYHRQTAHGTNNRVFKHVADINFHILSSCFKNLANAIVNKQ